MWCSLTRFEAFTVVKIQVEVFWVVTPCNVMVVYQRVRGPCYLHLHPADGSGIDLRHVGILPQHYTASQARRARLGVPLPLINIWGMHERIKSYSRNISQLMQLLAL
jgi:hypothetical protein